LVEPQELAGGEELVPEIEAIAALSDLVAGGAAEAAGVAGVLALGQGLGAAERIIAEGGLELGEVPPVQDGALPELGHVGAQVVDPDLFGVALVRPVLFGAARVKKSMLVFIPWA
jgi:hypothetical protein